MNSPHSGAAVSSPPITRPAMFISRFNVSLACLAAPLEHRHSAMTSKPLFRVLQPAARTAAVAETAIQIWFNDQPLSVPGARSVAAALLAAAGQRFRATPVPRAPRTPY